MVVLRPPGRALERAITMLLIEDFERSGKYYCADAAASAGTSVSGRDGEDVAMVATSERMFNGNDSSSKEKIK